MPDRQAVCMVRAHSCPNIIYKPKWNRSGISLLDVSFGQHKHYISKPYQLPIDRALLPSEAGYLNMSGSSSSPAVSP